MKRGFVFIVCLISLASYVSATNVYIDPSAQYNGDGSRGTQATCSGCSGAFNTWGSVSFSASDDYFQKCGTTYISGNYFDISGITATSSNHMVFGAYYLDAGSEVIGVSGSKPILKSSGNTAPIFRILDSSYIEVTNIDVREGAYPIWVGHSSNIYLHESAFGRGATTFGLRIQYSNHVYIYDNVVDSDADVEGIISADCGGVNYDGVQLYRTSYSEIYNNIINDWGHANVYINTNSDYNSVHDNYMDNTNVGYGRAFGVDVGSDHNMIYNNYFHNMRTRSQIGTGMYNEIYENIFDKTFFEESLGSGCKTDVAQALVFQGYGGGGPVQYNKFYNNIIYAAEDGGIRFYNNPGDSEVMDNEISNNVILESGDSTKWADAGIYVPTDTNGIRGNTFKNNVIFKTGDLITIDYRGTKMTVSEWNNADTNGDVIGANIGSDPSLIDPPDRDFTLAESSPCIDTGLNIGIHYSNGWDPLTSLPPNIVSTLDQNDYGSGWEIGAYVFTGAQTPTCKEGQITSTCLCGKVQFSSGYCCLEVWQSTSCSVGQQGLMAHYNFDEGQGTTAADSSGNGNDGTLVNRPTWATGKMGNYALQFDGVDDYVEVPDSATLDPGYMTFSMWFNPKSFADNAGLIVKGDNENRQYWVWIYQGNLSLEINDGGFHNHIYPLQKNTWYFLAVTYDGSSIATYINGALVSAIPQSTGPILDDDGPLYIGTLPGFVTFDGTIDDVKIWNRALSAQEVLDLNNQEAGSSESVCGSGADSDSDGIITISELIKFISRWKDGSATIAQLADAIRKWKDGC